MLDAIFAAHGAIATGIPGPPQDAPALEDRELGIFGGLLNCMQKGAMKMAVETFEKSNDLLDRLMEVETTIHFTTQLRHFMLPYSALIFDN